MPKRWENPFGDEIRTAQSVEQLIEILTNHRGIEGPVEEFLSRERLSDPAGIDNIEQAAERIKQAQKDNEKIALFADYDVDGVTSSAILSDLFDHLGIEYEVYIPHRIKEGYGLNEEAVRRLAKSSDLLVTVDLGVSNNQEVELAKSLGMDVVVMDHHERPKELPDALILHPEAGENPQPLAAVGLVYQFVSFFCEYFDEDYEYERNLGLAGLGTVADIVPLVGDNRVIAKRGIEQMRENPRRGMRALLDQAGIKNYEDVTAGRLGYFVGPRINAAGRMDHALTAYRLFKAETEEEAKLLANDLDQLNQKRQKLTDDLMERAIEHAKQQIDEGAKLLLVSGDYPVGVAGIVASKLADEFHRPAIVGEEQDDLIKASARSIKGVNLIEILREAESLLDSFGGHTQAAGLQVKKENQPQLFEQLQQKLRELPEDTFTPRLRVEALLTSDIGDELEQAGELIEQFAPFGAKNPKPVLALEDFRWANLLTTNSGNHLRGHLQVGRVHYPMIAFGFADRVRELSEADRIAFKLRNDEYNHGYSLQIVDFQ